MSYLLDTHSFLWAIFSPAKLPANVVNLLEDQSVEVQVSTISFWEIALKYSIGKLDLEGATPDEFPRLAEETGFKITPIDPRDAATSWQLQWHANHKDPFDRMLIWQALRNKMTLVSKDDKFNLYVNEGLKVFWG